VLLVAERHNCGELLDGGALLPRSDTQEVASLEGDISSNADV
jgi:hypothetical protein